jgi:hypothetical protein
MVVMIYSFLERSLSCGLKKKLAANPFFTMRSEMLCAIADLPDPAMP